MGITWGGDGTNRILCNIEIIVMYCIYVRPEPSIPVPRVIPHGHGIPCWHHVGCVLLSLWLLNWGLLLHMGLYHHVLHHGHCHPHVDLLLFPVRHSLSAAADG